MVIPYAALGQDGGRDWRFEVYQMRNVIFHCSLAQPPQDLVSCSHPLFQ